MTADPARWRKQRARRKAGLATVTITDDRRPGGVYRGEVPSVTARKWIAQMEEMRVETDESTTGLSGAAGEGSETACRG